MREYPNVALPVAYEIIKRLSSFVRNIDFALDWMVIDAGKSLYRYSCVQFFMLHLIRLPSLKKSFNNFFLIFVNFVSCS